MKYKKLALFAARFALIIFFLAVLPAVFAEEQYAVIERFEGTVYIKQTPDSAWENAREDMLLANGALIATGIKSFADIFISGAVITVDSLSRFILEIPEYAEINKQGEIRVPLTNYQRYAGGSNELIPWIPVGAGDNARIKVRPAEKTGVAGETMDGPANALGFDFKIPETPRAVNADVEIVWPAE
jgi:hypothetical protein